MQSAHGGKQFLPARLVEASSRQTKAEPVMRGRTNESSETIDYKTSRSICDAVGERLQQSLRPDSSRLSPRLQHLLDELRKQDREAHQRLPN
jgi:hypothetical protein